MEKINQLQEFKIKIRIVEISTSSWNEEDFKLLTTLTDEQINTILSPLIEEERDEVKNPNYIVLYDNEALTQALVKAYPEDIAYMYQELERIQL